MFIRVYRLEVPSVMLVFSTQLCVAPLTISLVHLPPPSLCEYVQLYMYIYCTVCKGGGGSIVQTDKHLPQKSFFTGQFFRWRMSKLHVARLFPSSIQRVAEPITISKKTYYFTWRGFWDTLHEQPRGQGVLSSRDLNRNTIWKIVSVQGIWRPDLDPVRRGTF